ncbi:hypothetical protein M0804_004865 [Polistes exclamans]|nr:hypothetical protein M0804_004865 [Polistes exclamans]
MPIFGCTKEDNCRKNALLRARERANQRDKEPKTNDENVRKRDSTTTNSSQMDELHSRTNSAQSEIYENEDEDNEGLRKGIKYSLLEYVQRCYQYVEK